MSGGFDYYLATTLSGHDTAYNPDNENVSPREDYEYEDADEAINQPEIELRMMAGIRFRF